MLITGGAGFIGANFINFVLRNDPNIRLVNLDLLTYAGSQENLKYLPDPDRHTFIHGDINNLKLVKDLLRQHNIDTVVHFAAESHVDRSILGTEPFIRTNVVGTFMLLEAVREVWLVDKILPLEDIRFHHISTDEVYGSIDPDAPPFSETTTYAPNSPYAASKASSDHLVRSYGHTFGLPISITNCSNNYGPYQFPEKLIPLMILNATEGRSLPIYGDGEHVRDWLYVEDHCEAIWRVLKADSVGETYNIGGENQPANVEVVRLLCGVLDEMLPDSPYRPHAELIEFVADRPGHDRRYAMDIQKIKDQLGWKPRETLESGLCKTAAWYLDNIEWINAINARTTYQEWIEQNYAVRGTDR
jgi:dTDP-glucose 4,6-dehydratase